MPDGLQSFKPMERRAKRGRYNAVSLGNENGPDQGPESPLPRKIVGHGKWRSAARVARSKRPTSRSTWSWRSTVGADRRIVALRARGAGGAERACRHAACQRSKQNPPRRTTTRGARLRAARPHRTPVAGDGSARDGANHRRQAVLACNLCRTAGGSRQGAWRRDHFLRASGASAVSGRGEAIQVRRPGGQERHRATTCARLVLAGSFRHAGGDDRCDGSRCCRRPEKTRHLGPLVLGRC